MKLLAHGLGNIQDLPVPAWLFLYGASMVLVVSFVALGALWKKPRLEDDRPRALPPSVQRGLALARIPLAAASFGLLVVIFLAAAFGVDSVAFNFAPTFVFVVFWLGLVPVQALVGDVYRAINPWRAAADGVGWVTRRLGGGWEPPFTYPERLGRWPAAVLLFAYATLELAYWDPAGPRTLAIAIAVYSWITWVGMLAFGTRTWLSNGEAFAAYFGLLARLAPLGVRDGAVVRRRPFTGVARDPERPGTIALVTVVLGSTLFDGFSRTTWWLDLRFSAEEPYALTNPALADAAGSGMNLLGLLTGVALIATAFLSALAVARRVTRTDRKLADAFLGSLIPIAFVYVVAHYFSLFILQGQLGIRLASDPFGRGWDLLGTAGFTGWWVSLDPNTIWYVQVGALVAGHVAGLVLAHDKAVGVFPRPKTATRAQYALLVLMILYTVGGMWVLSAG